MMKTMFKLLGYLAIAVVCAGALAASAYYVFDPKFANGSKAAASKGHGAEKGHDDHDEGVKLTETEGWQHAVQGKGKQLVPATGEVRLVTNPVGSK